MTTVRIPLTQGYVALVDDADADSVLAFRWSAVPIGQTVYAQRSARRADGRWTTQSLHKFLTVTGNYSSSSWRAEQCPT